MQPKGTQFKFFQANPKEMGGRTTHTLEAWSAEHAGTEWANARPEVRAQYTGSSGIDPGTRPIASMSWEHKTGEIKGIYTEPEHQRQGVASSLWQEGHRIAGETRGVPKPRHSAFRTASGEAWSKAVGGRRPPRNMA